MSSAIPFNKQLNFEYGRADQLSPLVRRVIANNPGSFTLHGTGTYIIGQGEVAVVDPGPAYPEHIQALLDATRGETITHILVTHTHVDHSPGCALLKEHCNAGTWAFGTHGLGRAESDAGGDFDFVPDEMIVDKQVIAAGNWSVESIYTPGHSANHVAFYLQQEQALFCGDVVMGWSTTIVSPPDGNMSEYMQSLERLLRRGDKIYYPAHGAPIKDPPNYVRALYAHRVERGEQVIACISSGETRIQHMLPLMYADLDKSMYPAAARSVFATVEYLVQKGVLSTTGQVAIDADYALVSDT